MKTADPLSTTFAALADPIDGPREPGGLILGQSGGQLLLIAGVLGLFLALLTPGMSWPARGAIGPS